MQITRLKLLGFKSFVEPAELIIRPGLTGVVGPNGCGKSNLLEALRWVMGETSYKAMRGGAMDDVIFSGTQHRPARNSAEVTIEIDNRERTAPAEFNETETLEIVRVIERGAGSRYVLNGKEVRAKDIKLLFEDAATGARSHALVRQGQIGEIVNAKPQARRRILEDAAGIAGLHSRRHEAELRLKAAEDNLDRLSDVMGQMEAQLNSLKRQARHALRYKDLSQKLRKLEALIFHLKWRAAGEAITSVETELSGALEQVGLFTANEAKLHGLVLEANEALKPLREAEAVQAAVLNRLTSAQDSLESEEQQTRQRQEELSSNLTAAQHDLVREEHLIVEAKDLIKNLDLETNEISERVASLQKQKAEAQNELDGSTAALKGGEEKLSSIAGAYSDIKATHQSLTLQIEGFEKRIERYNERETTLIDEQAGLRIELEKIGDGLGLVAQITERKQTLASLQDTLKDIEHELSNSRSLESELASEVSQCALRSGTLATEISLLEKLLTSHASEIYEPALDQVFPEQGYELALWAALGDDLDAPLDENAPVYWRGVSGEHFPPLPDGIECLAGFVKVPIELQACLSQVGLVDEIEALEKQLQLKPGQRLVSVEGGLWRWDGFTTRSDAPSSAPQKLTERNRLPALERELATVKAAHDAVVARHAQVSATRVETEERLSETRRSHDQTQEEINALEADRQKLATETVAISSRIATIDETLKEARVERGSDKIALDQAQTQLASLDDLDEQRLMLEQQKETVALQRQRHSEAQLAFAGLSREEELNLKRRSSIAIEQERWRERSKLAEEHIGELNTRIETTKEGLRAFENLPQQFEERRSKLLDEISVAEKKRQDATDELVSAEGLCQQYDNELKGLQRSMMEVRETKARLEMKLETAREALTQIASDIRSNFDVMPDQCLEMAGFTGEDTLPELADALEDAARLKLEREKLGGVNLRAEEEIRALEDQFGGMISERDDLTQAISQLRGAISSINEEGRQRLLAAFDEVNDHFKRLFQTLFAGGEAALQLIDSDDPLESGLEIVARPPGKKPQVLTLLSGGEKALTALSLIFAVFLTNPSPICVLDEVDAPLDDTNVERFCRMMEDMAKNTNTRFLVITHHPMTMERMDRLFGVTMSEKGVSQLVSVDLATAESFKEAS